MSLSEAARLTDDVEIRPADSWAREMRRPDGAGGLLFISAKEDMFFALVCPWTG